MKNKFYNLALRFLSFRPRSEKEVRDRLKLKISHFAKASRDKQKLNLKDLTLIIDKVIEKLKEKKFINDEEFAKWWIESRLRFKPRSLRLIKIELKQKGIPDDIIQTIIHDSKFMIHSDLEQAKRLVERKMNRSRNKFGMTPEKLGRFLASKGFDWDTIKKSIDEAFEKGV